MKKSVLSLSGGMDSSSLLLHLLAKGYQVTALGFDYGQKHKVELERAKSLVEYLKSKGQNVTHQIIKLDGLSQLLNSALVEGGWDVPEGHYEQDNMKDTVVPNRNKIFASLIQAVALSIATKPITDDCSVGQEVAIAMGIHAGDHAIYPDCRQEFRDADDHAFRMGNWDAENVGYFTPYLEGDKFTILQDGEVLCGELGLEFDEVYSRTNTSYKPIRKLKIEKRFEGTANELNAITEIWYSDYKSASSVERVEAFIKLGRKDPVEYADENGEVTWEHVVNEVTKVLESHGN
jgi:7-cyano-7-deazaguanine synthase